MTFFLVAHIMATKNKTFWQLNFELLRLSQNWLVSQILHWLPNFVTPTLKTSDFQCRALSSLMYQKGAACIIL